MRIRAVAPFTALALSLAACGGGSSGGPSSVGSSSGAGNTGNTIAGMHANNHGTADVTGKSTVEIKAGNYYFQPSILKGTPGQQLTLHIVNVSGTEHNVSIDAQHVDKDVEGNESADAKVTMPASGTLAFWCSYHKSLGMVGGLNVSGSAGGSGGGSPSPSDDSGGGYGGYGNG